MNEPKDPSIEDELDSALAALDSSPLSTNTSAPSQALDGLSKADLAAPEQTTSPQDPPGASPTLDALDESRRPKASTVCEHCPNSVWFASPRELKCYCRVMFLVTWSSREPNQITHCDGEFLRQEQG